MTQSDPLTTKQRQIVNKRLTLNLLIQGSATHGHWEAHQLVAKELGDIHPDLFATYSEMMVRSRLGYWVGGIPSIMGNALKFWWKIQREGHEFGFHPFLVKHGFSIAQETRDDVFERCHKASIPINGFMNETRGIKIYQQALELELPHLRPLVELAKDVCCETYGIGRDMLDAELTQSPRFGVVREPETAGGKAILECMIGWSAVVRRQGQLKVKATATFWPMLVHELIKGSVELICLHGMGSDTVTDSEFDIALQRTDHVEFEIPMLQIGGTIFQRFLLARPREIPLAESIMHVAKLEPLVLEQFMFHLFESPNRATDTIRSAAATS